jgi:branched-chain amino acid transport system substrate-binding protein
LLLFSGCTRESTENNTSSLPAKAIKPESVQIGVFEPLSGAYQYAGNLELEGIKLAHELYPEVDGIKLELIIADNKSEKLESAHVVSELIQKAGADVLIGSWSSTLSISAGPIIKDLKVPAVAPTSTNQEVTLGNNYYFRACYVDSFQGTVMANYAYYDLNARSVMVVSEKGNEYSKGLARFFIERFIELNDAHGDVIQEIEYNPMTKDFQASIDEALKLDPKFIFLPGAYDESAHWILLAREAGIDAIFMGGDTWDNDVFLTYGGKAVEGAVFSTFYTSEIALTAESTTL